MFDELGAGGFTNGPDARLDGIELEYEHRFGARIKVDANLSYVDAERDATGEALPGGTPWLGNCAAVEGDRPLDRGAPTALRGRALPGRQADERPPLDAYTTADLTLNWRPPGRGVRCAPRGQESRQRRHALRESIRELRKGRAALSERLSPTWAPAVAIGRLHVLGSGLVVTRFGRTLISAALDAGLRLGQHAGSVGGEPLWREDEQRLRVGLKVFAAVLGAQEALAEKRSPDGDLEIVVACEGSAETARQAGTDLQERAPFVACPCASPPSPLRNSTGMPVPPSAGFSWPVSG